MKKRETRLQDACIKYARDKGIYILNTVGGTYSVIGTPDLLLCVRGVFVACELKVRDNTLSPAQRIIRERIISSGGRYFVPRTLEEFIDAIESV